MFQKFADKLFQKILKTALTLGVFAIVIIVLGFFLTERLALIPRQVQSSLTQNIDINNTISTKIKPVNADIITKSSAITAQIKTNLSSNLTIRALIEELNKKIKDLEAIIDQITNQKSKLNKGTVVETREFEELVSRNLDNTATSAKDIQEFIGYQTCILDSYLSSSEFFVKFVDEIKKVTITDFPPITRAVTYNQQASEAITGIRQCFAGSFGNLLTSSVSNSLDSAQSYSTTFNQLFTKIGGTLATEPGDKNIFEQLSLWNRFAVLPSFLTNGIFLAEVIEKPLAKIIAKLSSLDNQDQITNNKLNDIKGKYNLN